MFPPAVGGSGALLSSIYSRIVDGRVTALVGIDPARHATLRTDRLHVVQTRIDAGSWGLLDPTSWPNQLKLARQIQRLAARGRAIVHCGRAQPEGIPAFLASLMPGGPPYIFWAHGEDVTVGLSSRQYALTMRQVYRHASAAIANCHNTARLIESTGWHRNHVRVVYPGVDSLRFNPDADVDNLRSRFAARGELLLLSLSRLQPRKGHELVLRALPRLLRDMPGIRYVIVGEGGERPRLEALAKDLQLDRGVVHFTGEVPELEVPAYYAACDVFVLPTRVTPPDFEGFGLVFLEAAAAGKPSVGGRNGGVPEAVAEGETGMLVGGEDVDELARALRSLCESPHLRQRMGEAGRQRAIRDFTWEHAALAVSRIHHEVASRWPPRARQS
jgi:phosphatidylinositol alpha-1,6-mannosyltransferase